MCQEKPNCIEEAGTCPNGTTFSSCGKPCMHRCSETSSCVDLPKKSCKSGCFCPGGQIYDDNEQKCVSPSDCKCRSINFNRILSPGEIELVACNNCRLGCPNLDKLKFLS
jgi:hypothetical protein